MNACKKSCCWTPMEGICGRSRSCRCHVKEKTVEAFERAAAERTAAREEERRQTLTGRRAR